MYIRSCVSNVEERLINYYFHLLFNVNQFLPHEIKNNTTSDIKILCKAELSENYCYNMSYRQLHHAIRWMELMNSFYFLFWLSRLVCVVCLTIKILVLYLYMSFWLASSVTDLLDCVAVVALILSYDAHNGAFCFADFVWFSVYDTVMRCNHN